MSRPSEQPRRRSRGSQGSSGSGLSGRALRGGSVGYYPCTVIIAGAAHPCAVLEWQERQGVPVARVRYLGPDGRDYLTTVDAVLVTVGS
jgi:hypothetical protein